MRNTKKLGLFLICILLSACHPLFCIWQLGYKEVDKEDQLPPVVGFYQLDQHSNDQLYYELHYKPTKYTLELKQDNTYVFTNLPDCVLNVWGDSKGKVVNKTGKCFLSCDKSYGCWIELEKVATVSVYSKNNKAAILIPIGDGDECRGLAYVKK